MIQFDFDGFNCKVVFTRYAEGKRTAIVLVDAVEGEKVLTATVNMPEIPLAEDEVLIKDYSENRGVLDALVTAGVVGPPLEAVPTGYVSVHRCKLLVAPEAHV